MNRHLGEHVQQSPPGGRRLAVAIVAALAMMVVCGGMLVHKLREPGGGPVILKIAAGTDGGTYNALSRQLSRILNRRLKDVRFEPLPTQGGLQNLVTLVNGEAQIGFVQGPRLAAFVRENPAMAKEVAVIARVYPAYVQVVVSKRFQDRLRSASNTPAHEARLRSLKDLVKALEQGSFVGDHEAVNFYLGPEQSNSHYTAVSLLEAYGLREGQDYQRVDGINTFNEVLEKLGSEVDVAFISDGVPTPAVAEALARDKGARLIDVARPGGPGPLERLEMIPRRTYPNQDEDCRTLMVDEYLVCRRDLDPELVVRVTDTLFDNLTDLLLAHKVVHQIRLQDLLWPEDSELLPFGRAPADVLPRREVGTGPRPDLPPGIDLHEGVRLFARRDESKLMIASGPLGGTYHTTAKLIQAALEQQGIPTRVIPTDGSVENLRLMAKRRPMLAIVQRDVALASLWGQSQSIYKGRPPAVGGRPVTGRDLTPEADWGIESVGGMSRIATLHDEVLYIFASSKAVPRGETLEDLLTAAPDPSRAGAPRDTVIGLGMKNSGTCVLAKSVLAQALENLGSTPVRPVRTEYMTVDDMMHKLQYGDIAVGMVMGAESSELLTRPLFDMNVRLLDVSPQTLTKLNGQALKAHWLGYPDWTQPQPDPSRRLGTALSTESPGHGDRQTVSEAPGRDGGRPQPSPGPPAKRGVRTLKTRAVLVANEHIEATGKLSYRITRAIFEGRGLLENLEVDTLKQDIPSIPLHDQAKRYYQECGYLAADERWEWERSIPTLGGVLTLFLSLWAAVIAFNDRKAANQLTTRILAVDLRADNTRAAQELNQCRDEVRSPSRWRPFVRMDLNRWRVLTELIERNLQFAHREKTKYLAMRLRAIQSDGSSSPADLGQRLATFRAFVDGLLANGELEPTGYEFLLRLMSLGSPPAASVPPGPPTPPLAALDATKPSKNGEDSARSTRDVQRSRRRKQGREPAEEIAPRPCTSCPEAPR